MAVRAAGGWPVGPALFGVGADLLWGWVGGEAAEGWTPSPAPYWAGQSGAGPARRGSTGELASCPTLDRDGRGQSGAELAGVRGPGRLATGPSPNMGVTATSRSSHWLCIYIDYYFIIQVSLV